MSERRRKSGASEGRGKRALVWAGWAVVVVLLGGNLVIALVGSQKDGTPQSLVTPEDIETYGYWGAVTVAAIASVAGLAWASRAYRQNERSSLRWAQWTCVAGLLGAAYFAAISLDPELLPGRWLLVGAAVMFCVQTVLVSVLAYREHWRSVHGESRGHHAQREAAAVIGGPASPAIPGPPPESPGPAR